MSENILVDGKPLNLLRVVDLREELKKRNIRAVGTKVQLQDLLKESILQEALVGHINNSAVLSQPSELISREQALISENLPEDFTKATLESDQSLDRSRVASISINEENKTIKLSIRNHSDSTTPEKDSNVEPVYKAHRLILNTPVNRVEQKTELTSISSVQPIGEKVNEDDSKSNDGALESQSNNENQVVESQLLSKREPSKIETVASDSSETDHDESNSGSGSSESVEQESNDSESENKKSESLTTFEKEKEAQALNDLNVKASMPSQSPVKKIVFAKIESNTGQDLKSKPSIRCKLILQSKSINEEDAAKPAQKKRRWGGSIQSNEPSVLKKGISSDELKQLIKESVVDSANDNNNNSTKVSKVNAVNNEEELVEPTKIELIANEPEAKEEIKKVDISFKSSENAFVKKNDTNLNVVDTSQLNETKDIESVRALSPAKNPVSSVLFVSGLVRPYTLPQLKKLLSSHGAIDEEKFWIDKIKSKCYVVYANSEVASNTRESLHNLKWPQSSPKNLLVDFATLEDIDRCLHPENYEDLPPKVKPVENVNNNKVLKDKKEAGIDIGKGKYDIILNEPIRDEKEKNIDHVKEDLARGEREWDRNKGTRIIATLSGKENEENNRKRPRHVSPSVPSPLDKKDIKDEKRKKTSEELTSKEDIKRQSESPAKLLEDLFHKTKTTPYIYWLPLTDEQFVEKEKQKLVFEKERQERNVIRREAESKREIVNSPPTNRPPPPNYHNFPPRERFNVPNFRRRASPSPSRRKRSPSASPRRYSRYSKSRSPDRRRFSPRRRR